MRQIVETKNVFLLLEYLIGSFFILKPIHFLNIECAGNQRIREINTDDNYIIDIHLLSLLFIHNY